MIITFCYKILITEKIYESMSSGIIIVNDRPQATLNITVKKLGTRVTLHKADAVIIDTGSVTVFSQNMLCSFSNLSVTSPTSQLILQPFHRFTYITAHSQILPLLHLHHSSFSNTSFASPTSQALHLHHLVSRPCCQLSCF